MYEKSTKRISRQPAFAIKNCDVEKRMSVSFEQSTTITSTTSDTCSSIHVHAPVIENNEPRPFE